MQVPLRIKILSGTKYKPPNAQPYAGLWEIKFPIGYRAKTLAGQKIFLFSGRQEAKTLTKAPNCIGFSPLADSECTHLILGSMPSVASLKAEEYYAHPQNRFWPLMAAILTGEKAPADYEARKAMLFRHHVALWDAISACCRDGSLDSAISEEQGNDFAAFLPQYPKIKTICFNGAKSAQCFKKYNRALLERDDLRFFAMPSTSPANAAWSFARLLGKWGEAWE